MKNLYHCEGVSGETKCVEEKRREGGIRGGGKRAGHGVCRSFKLRVIIYINVQYVVMQNDNINM
jgi:hypothetical protein